MGNFTAKWNQFTEAFIEQNGYEKVIEGLQNTVIIAVLGLLIGILIGIIIATVRVVPKYNWLPRILNGVCSVYAQTEAGRSLGLPYRVVMARIILPQAVKNVLPALVNELIALLKETSIVGYIGLRDLTRGADVIRSQTWVAFAPLLGAAAIYLLIVILLTKLAGRIERRLGQSDRG